jgi:hypothetical protein
VVGGSTWQRHQPLFLLVEVLRHLQMMLQSWQRLSGPVFQLPPASIASKRPESVPELIDRRLIILMVSPKWSVGG